MCVCMGYVRTCVHEFICISKHPYASTGSHRLRGIHFTYPVLDKTLDRVCGACGRGTYAQPGGVLPSQHVHSVLYGHSDP